MSLGLGGWQGPVVKALCSETPLVGSHASQNTAKSQEGGKDGSGQLKEVSKPSPSVGVICSLLIPYT